MVEGEMVEGEQFMEGLPERMIPIESMDQVPEEYFAIQDQYGNFYAVPEGFQIEEVEGGDIQYYKFNEQFQAVMIFLNTIPLKHSITVGTLKHPVSLDDSPVWPFEASPDTSVKDTEYVSAWTHVKKDKTLKINPD